METFEQFQLIDNNFGGPLVQIRNKVTGEELWCRRSRCHLVGEGYILTSERQAIILRNALARQEAREKKRQAKLKLAAQAEAAEPKIQSEVAA